MKTMIVLFGDSWARQSYRHSTDFSQAGYLHWQLKDTNVALNTNTWLHHYFKKHISINQANFGNTLEWIIQDMFHFKNIFNNLNHPLNFVIFQTDPLRIFAPRADYTNSELVWENFIVWAEQNKFDWSTQGLTELTEHIYLKWYQDLVGFEQQEQAAGRKVNFYLVGGVSKIHQCVTQTPIKVLLPSICEHFGLKSDLEFENRASLACFVEIWQQRVSLKHRTIIKQQWDAYENALVLKENFWITNPTLFAGRHLTSAAMAEIAEYIENQLELVRPITP